MTNNNQTVYIIDDDIELCKALAWTLESITVNVKTFQSPHDFLNQYNNEPGCLVLDVRLSDINGLKLQEKLKREGFDIPIIFITGHGDIPMAVRAMKAGAVDFFTKPFNNQMLIDAIQDALIISQKRHSKRTKQQKLLSHISSLTDRENDVMRGILDSKLSKTIAHELGISLNTVDVHRANIMKKMQAKSTIDLVKMIVQNDIIKA